MANSDISGEGRPEDHAGTDPNAPPQACDGDARSDIEQAVQSRADAVERGEGVSEPEPMTAPGLHAGVGGTGGKVRNQDMDQQ